MTPSVSDQLGEEMLVPRVVACACLVVAARASSSHAHHKEHDEQLQPEDKSAVVVLLDEHRKGRDTLRLLPSMQEHWPWLYAPTAARARRVPVVLFHVEGAPGSPHPFLSDALRSALVSSAPKLRLVFIRIEAKDHLGPGGRYGGYAFCSQFLAHDMYFSLGARFPGPLEQLLRIDEDALIVPPVVTVDLFEEMARRGKRVANLQARAGPRSAPRGGGVGDEAEPPSPAPLPYNPSLTLPGTSQAGKTENTGKMNEMHARALKYVAAERARADGGGHGGGGGARAHHSATDDDGRVFARPSLAEGVDAKGADAAARTLQRWFTLPCEEGKTKDFPTCRPPNFTASAPCAAFAPRAPSRSQLRDS